MAPLAGLNVRPIKVAALSAVRTGAPGSRRSRSRDDQPSVSCRPHGSLPRRSPGGHRVLPGASELLVIVDDGGAAAGQTTTTDSRSQRNLASRRGGQLASRALSPYRLTACPHICSRKPLSRSAEATTQTRHLHETVSCQ